MNISVEVRSGDIKSGAMERTTECVIVFVSVDAQGKPMPVDGWNPETPGEVALATRVRAQIEASRAHR
jgi:acyl-CoA hydrolase